MLRAWPSIPRMGGSRLPRSTRRNTSRSGISSIFNARSASRRTSCRAPRRYSKERRGSASSSIVWRPRARWPVLPATAVWRWVCGWRSIVASTERGSILRIRPCSKLRACSATPVRFEGLATHAGHSYKARSTVALRDVAEQERLAVVRAAERLRADGIPVQGVSAGSTPTVMHLLEGEGLTELRAGVYMAGDLFQVALGSLALEQVAVTVLATVISHNPKRNQVVVDAGGLALSKDRSTAAGAGPDMGYGLILDVLGRPITSSLTVVDVHQEHGEIRSSSRLPFEKLPIGSKIRIIPNHVCMTAAMYDAYLVVDGTDAIV